MFSSIFLLEGESWNTPKEPGQPTSWGKRASLICNTNWSLAKEEKWPGKKRVQNSSNFILHGHVSNEASPQNGLSPTAFLASGFLPHKIHTLANAILPKSTKVLSFCLSVSLAFIHLSLLISLWPHWPNTFTLPVPYTSYFSLRQYCTLVEVLWPPWWHRCRFPRLGFAGCLLVAWGLHRQMKLTLFVHEQVSPIEGF